jgi:hypothetical protein
MILQQLRVGSYLQDYPGHLGGWLIALEPEFIRPPDGTQKQDCELRASQHWLERNA